MSSSYNYYTPRALPVNEYRFIAPYWSDTDIEGKGEVYYRQTNNSDLLSRATDEIQRAFPFSQNLNITNLVIATWDAVGYFFEGSDKVCT